MKCPSCGSENTAKLSVVNAEGTFDMNGTTSVSTGGFVGGHYAFMSGGGTTKGHYVSKLAKRTARPTRRPIFIPIVVWIVLVGVHLVDWRLGPHWLHFDLSGTTWEGYVTMGIVTALCLAWELHGLHHNFGGGLRHERHIWGCTWMCKSCGHKWT